MNWFRKRQVDRKRITANEQAASRAHKESSIAIDNTKRPTQNLAKALRDNHIIILIRRATSDRF